MVRGPGHHRTAGRRFCAITPMQLPQSNLCVVPTVTFDRLFAFLIVSHGRRQLLWFAVTGVRRRSGWSGRSLKRFHGHRRQPISCGTMTAPTGKFFTARVAAMGIRDRPISPGSPWQNGIAERLIGTLRRECLDHFIVFGERHLRGVLSAYAAYYNQTRPHRSLQKDAPMRRTVQRIGDIVAIPILGGLHHHYVRI